MCETLTLWADQGFGATPPPEGVGRAARVTPDAADPRRGNRGGRPPPGMGRALERVGPEAFDGTKLRRRGVVAVAFLADWCPFCRSFDPEFAALSTDDVPGRLVADVTDEASPLWDRFGVEIVPTVVVFRDGSPVFRADGVAGEGLGQRELAAIAAAARRASADGAP